MKQMKTSQKKNDVCSSLVGFSRNNPPSLIPSLIPWARGGEERACPQVRGVKGFGREIEANEDHMVDHEVAGVCACV